MSLKLLSFFHPHWESVFPFVGLTSPCRVGVEIYFKLKTFEMQQMPKEALCGLLLSDLKTEPFGEWSCQIPFPRKQTSPSDQKRNYTNTVAVILPSICFPQSPFVFPIKGPFVLPIELLPLVKLVYKPLFLAFPWACSSECSHMWIKLVFFPPVNLLLSVNLQAPDSWT